MSWAIGFDSKWGRDIGYGVPCICDHPDCNKRIDRGLAFVCGHKPYGGEDGCGLYFCEEHKNLLCERCEESRPPFKPKKDVREWINHKLTHRSWSEWRKENKAEVGRLKKRLSIELTKGESL